MIKSYETTYLITSRVDEAGVISIINKIKGDITALEGKILNESQVRVADLGYPIKDEHKANLFELAFEFEGTKLEELTGKFKENDQVLRFLLKEFIPRKAEPIKSETKEKPQKVELEDIDKKIEEIFESDQKDESK
jgi:ribosomal protein S6